MTCRHLITVLTLALGAQVSSLPLQAADAGTEFFESKIRPVLAEHCYECHSATAKKLKGGLRVDGKAELLKGGETGPAIVPGKPESSLLLKAISHGDPDLKMPPKQEKLPAAVIADLTKWVRDGAPWPAGDVVAAASTAKPAFNLEERKAKQPWLWAIPRPVKAPDVKDKKWATTPEDRFILQKLEEAKLKPAPPADDRTWLRRVHFAITGLPPTPDEIKAFLADTKGGARKRVVDRLLASPQYGERWARHWMDLVRYAESRGHEGDYGIANAWRYRDYLINAFNADVPYDDFVTEHIAGDLLPKPRLRPGTEINESVLATGWAFLGEENHSPVDIRQDECERIDNKVDVFSKTFLGLTVACARCHDHKFDPIRAQDYYALSGFMLGSSFRQVRFEAMENNRKLGAELRSLRAEYLPRLGKLIEFSREKGVQNIAASLLASREVILSAQPEATLATEARKRKLDPILLQRWVAHVRQAATNQSNPLHLFAKYSLVRDAAVPGRFGELIAASNHQPKSPALSAGVRIIADYTKAGPTPWKVDGEAFGTRPLVPGDLVVSSNPTNPIAHVMTYGAARRNLFWSRIRNAPDNENDSGQLGATARAGQMLSTPTVTLGVGRLYYLIKGKARVYAAVDSHIMIEGPLHGRLMQTVASVGQDEPRWVTHDLTAYSGHRVHVEFGPDGSSNFEVLMVVEAEKAPEWLPPAWIFEPGSKSASLEDAAMELQRAIDYANQQLGANRLKFEPDALKKSTLADWLVENHALFTDGPDATVISKTLEYSAIVSNTMSRIKWESHTAVAWFDGTGVDENILVRGKPFKPGPVAPRSLPAAFAYARPITNVNSSGRLELAKQMLDPANPQIARVLVNRVWHHLFGRGIVASVDNFGMLGDRPTHPELLDYLAWQFIHEDQWSIKSLIKRLVLTHTFAMSSQLADARSEAADPSNLLLHRMPVRRLEGEVIRDNLLAVSGRLNKQVGGPPVTVYLTEFLQGRGRPEKSGPLDGDGRRSIYTAMRRNFLPTMMQAFDLPTPFSTVGKRNVTNVPAQSLVLMNDPLFHQQARVWAERLGRETQGATPAQKIRWLFETAYGRLPTNAETAACTASLAEFRKLVKAADESKVEVWTELCHSLLNANDFIYVR